MNKRKMCPIIDEEVQLIKDREHLVDGSYEIFRRCTSENYCPKVKKEGSRPNLKFCHFNGFFFP